MALLALLMAAAFLLEYYLKEKVVPTFSYGFDKFSLSAPLPTCARWKDNMPSVRDPAAFHLYIEARKVWRSKIEWQLTRTETTQIL